MPAYTQNGYAKMKIPSQLYELINEAKGGSKIVTEPCNEVLQNCARVKEDGTIGIDIIFIWASFEQACVPTPSLCLLSLLLYFYSSFRNEK